MAGVLEEMQLQIVDLTKAINKLSNQISEPKNMSTPLVRDFGYVNWGEEHEIVKTQKWVTVSQLDRKLNRIQLQRNRAHAIAYTTIKIDEVTRFPEDGLYVDTSAPEIMYALLNFRRYPDVNPLENIEIFKIFKNHLHSRVSFENRYKLKWINQNIAVLNNDIKNSTNNGSDKGANGSERNANEKDEVAKNDDNPTSGNINTNNVDLSSLESASNLEENKHSLGVQTKNGKTIEGDVISQNTCPVDNNDNTNLLEISSQKEGDDDLAVEQVDKVSTTEDNTTSGNINTNNVDLSSLESASNLEENKHSLGVQTNNGKTIEGDVISQNTCPVDNNDNTNLLEISSQKEGDDDLAVEQVDKVSTTEDNTTSGNINTNNVDISCLESAPILKDNEHSLSKHVDDDEEAIFNPKPLNTLPEESPNLDQKSAQKGNNSKEITQSLHESSLKPNNQTPSTSSDNGDTEEIFSKDDIVELYESVTDLLDKFTQCDLKNLVLELRALPNNVGTLRIVVELFVDNYKEIMDELYKNRVKSFVQDMKDFYFYFLTTTERFEILIKLLFDHLAEHPDLSSHFASIFNILTVNNKTFREPLQRKCLTELEISLSDDTSMADDNDDGMIKRCVVIIKLIGELYKRDSISTNSVEHCLKQLQEKITDIHLECICELLSIIGKKMQQEIPKKLSDILKYISNIGRSDAYQISEHITRMIQETVRLSQRNWEVLPPPKSVEQMQKENQQKKLLESIILTSDLMDHHNQTYRRMETRLSRKYSDKRLEECYQESELFAESEEHKFDGDLQKPKEKSIRKYSVEKLKSMIDMAYMRIRDPTLLDPIFAKVLVDPSMQEYRLLCKFPLDIL